MNMNDIVGSHDLLFVTLDTLRYDVAAELLEAGRLPNLARVLPKDAAGRAYWEERHSPGSFTFAAHAAFILTEERLPAIEKANGAGGGWYMR